MSDEQGDDRLAARVAELEQENADLKQRAREALRADPAETEQPDE